MIVGAGFASTLHALSAAPVEITIIDRHNYHCFQPLLYQVATATLSPADVAWPIRPWSGTRRRRARLATVTGVDATGKLIFADGRAFPFDYLILASSATHSYFGHPEWAQVAPGLKTIEDATAIRRATLLAFEKAEFAQTDQDRKGYLSFVVVGGGYRARLEMTGGIAAIAKGSLHPDFRHIDARDATIRLIEAGPRILPALPPKLSDYAKRTLERLGVQVDIVAGHGVHRKWGRNGERLHRGGDDRLGRGSCNIARGPMAWRESGQSGRSRPLKTCR